MRLTELLKAWDNKRDVMTLDRRKTELEVLCKIVIPQVLAAGDEVPLPGIGKLKVKNIPARTGRNPKTGETINIPAKVKAVLVMSKAFQDVLNK